ncbi:hypothetical protein N8T08_009291 [Aspergillus melleus]|uniref:Uncharacterized protein n=1 Tax=Aspergillus melleus TaxID=138277 RepID=A0ACC3ATX7_9EURO|nr:hypothetical protein N8T08_009291 [Aspergillus melleus]
MADGVIKSSGPRPACDRCRGQKLRCVWETGSQQCRRGADSTQEELYFLHGAESPAIGYAFLTFDGSDQGLVLQQDGMRLRPDWEIVSSAVLDLPGQSLGGYLGLRGAADARIKACIAVDPVYDLWDFAMSCEKGKRALGCSSMSPMGFMLVSSFRRL